MIYLVVRKTTEWRDEAAVRAQFPEGFAPLVDLWDATFSLPYHLFRHELKTIAELSWSRVAGATRVPREDVPEGGVIVPTDDDDWFSPELAASIEAVPGAAGWYWPSRFLELPIHLRHRLGKLRRRLFPWVRPRWLCTTNNYAFVNGAVPPRILDSHMRASDWFVGHPAEVRRLDAPLSVMNRSLASVTTLVYGGPVTRAGLLRKYARYRKLYRAPPPDLAWSAPYVEAMAELMGRLRTR